MKINIGIEEDVRIKIADNLKRLLADTYMLYFKTHSYHWNVTGSLFETLHTLFEQQYNEMWQAVDVIAERIRALGVFTPASYQEFIQLTSIIDDKDVPRSNEMLKNLVVGHEAVIRTIRDIFPMAEEANDQSTLDVLTQRLTIHEKTAWMLRSMLD